MAALSVFGQSNGEAADDNAALIEQLTPIIQAMVKEAVRNELCDAAAKQKAEAGTEKQEAARQTETVTAGTLPQNIMSKGGISKGTMTAFLRSKNPKLSRDYAESLAAMYIREAEAEGVNYEIAFAQMCYHTNYLSFRAVFAPESANNFCGLSAVNAYGAYKFESIEKGVRAHILHLQAYAGTARSRNSAADPRYDLVLKQYGQGSAPTVDSLAGKWSPANPDYTAAIRTILAELHAFK
jgi:hypothetical protein